MSFSYKYQKLCCGKDEYPNILARAPRGCPAPPRYSSSKLRIATPAKSTFTIAPIRAIVYVIVSISSSRSGSARNHGRYRRIAYECLQDH